MQGLKVSCPFCGHANQIDPSAYNGVQELINLYDQCEHCRRVYGFDIEINYLTTSFDPKFANNN